MSSFISLSNLTDKPSIPLLVFACKLSIIFMIPATVPSAQRVAGALSPPMRVEGEVMRGGGRIYITHGHTLCARHAHARNTPEERWARWTCVRITLGVRSRCAMCALYLSRRTHNACPVCAPRVPRVCLALVQRALRTAGVLLACTFIRRAPRTVLCMHKNPDAQNEGRRMHSVGPARSTHE